MIDNIHQQMQICIDVFANMRFYHSFGDLIYTGRGSNGRCCFEEMTPTTERNLTFVLPAHLGNQQSCRQDNSVRRMLYKMCAFITNAL